MKARVGQLSPEMQTEVDALLAEILRPFGRGDPVRHHYIPQFYQRRFAGDNEHLMVVPVDGSEPRSRHISDIAVESHLYTALMDQVGETVAIERLLARADGKAAA